MKTKILFCIGVIISMLFFLGCEGPEGPVGPACPVLAINTIDANPFILYPGDLSTITADYNYSGDSTINFSWETTGGNFIGSTNTAIIQWAAPQATGFYTITLILSDNENEAIGHCTIQVIGDLNFFREDWEDGINDQIWFSSGNPSTINTGYNSIHSFEPNNGGCASIQTFDLQSNPVVEFWAYGFATQSASQSLRIGWLDGTSVGYNTNMSRIITIGISPETQSSYHNIVYSTNTGETHEEEWEDEWDYQWMKYRIQVNNDGTVSFFRSNPDSNDLNLIFTSTITIDLSQYSQQSFVLQGRYDVYCDDILIEY